MPKTEYFTDPEKYFKTVFDPATVVKMVRVINDNMVAVTYENEDEFADVMGNTNSVIAAFTTAQARLKLYSYMEKLGKRVLYFDTDSLLYKDFPSAEYKPPIGNYLGKLFLVLSKSLEQSLLSFRRNDGRIGKGLWKRQLHNCLRFWWTKALWLRCVEHQKTTVRHSYES